MAVFVGASVPTFCFEKDSGFCVQTKFSFRNHLRIRTSPQTLRNSHQSLAARLVCRAEPINLPKVERPQETLKRLGQEPKPSLGQNFLLDQQVVIDTVKAGNIQPGDHVIEVGPGTGVLTRGLLEAGARVTAVEKDKSLAGALETQFKDHPQLQVVCDDFVRWRKKQRLLPNEMEKVKVVANLPYNITSDALKRLLPMGDDISDVVVMVQLEAAQRFTSASPGDGDYRPISVRVHFYSTPEFVRKVDKSLYYPAPAVDGAIIRFKLKPSNEVPQVDPLEFFKLIGAAFVSKRKMLRNNLASIGYNAATVREALQQIGMSPTARPADLTMEKYVGLHQTLLSRKQR
mmetsp:Transcript_14756/g.31654  ORF Transcript_14756/g.31654 Transcript_14756/m.31654 type:complete len:345 (-) Transcript_14756:1449-2483(-)